MTYDEWECGVPACIKADVLWNVSAYRISLFAAKLAWHDVVKLAEDRRMFSLSDQLYRAVGSISANVAEGFSRGSPKERARFYEYALGSARETRDWYYKAAPVLGETVVEHRMHLVTETIRLLLAMVPEQRQHGERL